MFDILPAGGGVTIPVEIAPAKPTRSRRRELNRERLLELAHFISKLEFYHCQVPKVGQQYLTFSGWYNHLDKKGRATNTPSCATVGCIAGWTTHLYGEPLPRGGSWYLRQAVDLLGLTTGQAYALFMPPIVTVKAPIVAQVLRWLATHKGHAPPRAIKEAWRGAIGGHPYPL